MKQISASLSRMVGVVFALLLISSAAYAISSVDQGFQAGWFTGDGKNLTNLNATQMINGILGISYGGTGASTAAGARANLGIDNSSLQKGEYNLIGQAVATNVSYYMNTSSNPYGRYYTLVTQMWDNSTVTGDKVAQYAAARTGGTGASNIWAGNFLIDVKHPISNADGIEIDVNTNQTGIGNGLVITGASEVNPNFAIAINMGGFSGVKWIRGIDIKNAANPMYITAVPDSGSSTIEIDDGQHNGYPLYIWNISVPVLIKNGGTNPTMDTFVLQNSTGVNMFNVQQTGATSQVIIGSLAGSGNSAIYADNTGKLYRNATIAGVLSVSGTAPVTSSGGATPAISMAAASTSVNGYLTSTDWNTFNGKSPLIGSSSLVTTGTITTGTWSATDVAVAAGGTGASDAATARTNLGAAGSTQPAWNDVSFTNSWVNFDATSYESAQYMKDTSGFVHIRGLIKDGTLGASAFTLPAGYRPARVIFAPAISSGASSGYAAFGADGTVTPNGGNNTWWSFGEIVFSTS